MQLLVAVINHSECLDDILSGFVGLGIAGATVIESMGMARVLSHQVPLFAGAREFRTYSRPENRTVFCLVDDATLDAAIELVQEVCGSLDRPGAGIAFTLPVGRVVGLKPDADA